VSSFESRLSVIHNPVGCVTNGTHRMLSKEPLGEPSVYLNSGLPVRFLGSIGTMQYTERDDRGQN